MNNCVREFTNLSSELITCIIFLYISGIIFLFLGIYLTEILPKEFGVRKHPLFCLKRRKKKVKQTKETEFLLPENEKIIIENDEDIDCQQERFKVNSLNDDFDFSKYSLVCKNLRKVYKNSGLFILKFFKKIFIFYLLIKKKNQIF